MATEKRLIDANACPALFEEKFKETMTLIRNGETHLDNLAEGFTEASQVIWLMSIYNTVDAVEVVRCKDCKHYETDQYGCFCTFHSKKETEDYPAFDLQMLPNDFCSYGERRSDG